MTSSLVFIPVSCDAGEVPWQVPRRVPRGNSQARWPCRVTGLPMGERANLYAPTSVGCWMQAAPLGRKGTRVQSGLFSSGSSGREPICGLTDSTTLEQRPWFAGRAGGAPGQPLTSWLHSLLYVTVSSWDDQARGSLGLPCTCKALHSTWPIRGSP